MLSTSGPFSQTLRITQSHPSAILHLLVPPSSRPQNRPTIAGTPHRVSRVASRGDLKKTSRDWRRACAWGIASHLLYAFLTLFLFPFSHSFQHTCTIHNMYILSTAHACLGVPCFPNAPGSLHNMHHQQHAAALLMCVLRAFSTPTKEKPGVRVSESDKCEWAF